MIRPGGAFEEAFLALVVEQPKLVSDIVTDLRERGWHGFDAADVRSCVWRLADAGKLQRRSREHGAGSAEYVAKVPFDTVVDGRGRTRAVSL